MAERPRYGTPDWEVVHRWLGLAEPDDGPVWMVNLMKYRAVADYGRSDGPAVTGRDADDRYAPLGPLRAVGAAVAYLADVTAQPAGQPAWDRVGIVRYPSRRAFFAMQERDDFKQKHVHKEAGMEFTIVMGCQPTQWASGPPSPEPGEQVVMRVRRRRPGADPGPDPAGLRPVARFDVDGVVLGDGRRFDQVCFDLAGPAAVAALGDDPGAEELVAMVLDPTIDHLVESVTEVGGGR